MSTTKTTRKKRYLLATEERDWCSEIVEADSPQAAVLVDRGGGPLEEGCTWEVYEVVGNPTVLKSVVSLEVQ